MPEVLVDVVVFTLPDSTWFTFFLLLSVFDLTLSFAFVSVFISDDFFAPVDVVVFDETVGFALPPDVIFAILVITLVLAAILTIEFALIISVSLI